MALMAISIRGLGQLNKAHHYEQLDPYALNSNGGTTTINQMTIDWSVESLSNTLTFNNKPAMLISTGFLQNGYDVLTHFNQLENFGLQIKVGPNPFTNFIHIYCSQDGIDILGIQVYSSQGLLIKNVVGPFSGLQFAQTIALQKLSTPIYFVQVKYIVANKYMLNKTFKLIQY
jgi:hypothetical protein